MNRRVNQAIRRDEIIDATIRLIINKGFDAVTMREVAAEAGYAHGGLTRYFPRKQSLLKFAILRTFRRAEEEIELAVDQKTGLAALEACCKTILPYGQQSSPFARVILAFWNHAGQDSEFRDLHHKQNLVWRDYYLRFLQQAASDGEVPASLDLNMAVNTIFAHNAGWQTASALMPEFATDAQMDKSVHHLLESFRKH